MVLGEKHGTNYLPCTFALSQKRKCQIGLHQNFLMEYPKEKILEISSSSLVSLGAKLSAMHLSKRTLKGITTVESVFQSSRIYSDGIKRIGPFLYERYYIQW